MKLIEMICPRCGAHLQVPANAKRLHCDHCGTTLLVDDEVQHIQYDNAEDAGYQFEKGRQRAKREAGHSSKNRSSTGDNQKKKRTWLWILGWLVIFPVPLTILLLRKKQMKPVLKYGIIAAAWILYLIIGFSGGDGSSNSDSVNRGAQPQQVVPSKSVVTERSSEKTNVSEIHFSDVNEVTVKQGEKSKTGTVQVTLKNSFIYSADDIQFISDNPEIAVITYAKSSYGKTVYYDITGISPGETFVYATSKDGSVTSEKIKVIVPIPIAIEGVSVEVSENTLVLGETMRAVAVISPTNADNQQIVWTSSEEAVASIDDKGNIAAISGGTTTITATATNGVQGSVVLTVDSTKRLMKMNTIVDRQDDNNIGDEWSYVFKVNDEETRRGEYIIAAGDTLSFYAQCTESDDKPDVGDAKGKRTISHQDFEEGFTARLTVNVKENGGKNAGKVAQFYMKFVFTPVQ